MQEPQDLLPLPSFNDMDSGVSTGYSSASGKYSLPIGIWSSRRSSINSEGCESSIIDTIGTAKPHFRQIAFDNTWETQVIQNGGTFITSGVSFSEDIISAAKPQLTATKRRNGKVGFRSLKRLKLIPGRRKSVSTRSKATMYLTYY